MLLFRNDRELADQLMAHIDEWIGKTATTDSPAESAFIDWVEERKRIAKITADLSNTNTRAW